MLNLIDLLLQDGFDQLYDEIVTVEESSGHKIRYFTNKKIKYIWDGNKLQFLPSKYIFKLTRLTIIHFKLDIIFQAV